MPEGSISDQRVAIVYCEYEHFFNKKNWIYNPIIFNEKGEQR